MFDNICADAMRVHRAHRNTDCLGLGDFLYALWMNYGLQALVIYRFGRWLHNLSQQPWGWIAAGLGYPLFWLSALLVRKAYGIDLAQTADIAPGFYINHFGGVVVRHCRIGQRCNIQQQVKLGTENAGEQQLVIGNSVYIGAHAKICAAVTIGDEATIGAGAVVTQDIPARCLVLGDPARIVQSNYDSIITN
ncbi:DapH/DapD/GlmU-related protein [Methylococcus sp. ANG]|uniref:serine O-acetyltransferase n=1 Tax=unclassified Methylococcus TaxID=2618889 RepID=UPI001C5342A6|nr:DapH/DapD/GlmU-related protein [Methylococcus sp. Mc7]QXP84197.1 serine acetyltransferase [Methylococcus sp. Mc7]